MINLNGLIYQKIFIDVQIQALIKCMMDLFILANGLIKNFMEEENCFRNQMATSTTYTKDIGKMEGKMDMADKLIMTVIHMRVNGLMT